MDNLLSNAKLIAEGNNSQIYLYDKDPYDRPVILKVLKDEFSLYPGNNQIINEDNLIRNINIKGVRSSLDRIEIGNRQILILEYFDGITLSQYIKSRPPITERLKLAISIGTILAEIHNQQIIHKDINSNNILINGLGEVNIIDFGFSTSANETLFTVSSESLEGTLEYISPEQTGRTDHPIDHRSDLYSFGVILFELFAGRLPFSNTDPMELVHAHLALQPVPPNELNPEVPAVISDIVLKLLAKNVEERYQSTFGLLSDLKQCLEHMEKTGIKQFPLAQHDALGRLVLPTKLYGRDKELNFLFYSLEKIRQGSSEIIFIPGFAGSGKTSLVNTVKPKISKGTHFITGKNEQYQQDVPYYALAQSLNEWVNLILSKKEEELQHWRLLITTALGLEAKLLTNLVPKLELIIGKQEDLEGLEPTEAQHRFIYTFSKFIKAIANQDNPLVLFIDDLQWLDIASYRVLKNILAEPELSYFLFIGAFRSNEVDKTHHVQQLTDVLEKQGIPSHKLEVNDLSIIDINHLISDTFHLDEIHAEELTNIVYMKTAGNPFFVNQFLQSMYDDGLIRFTYSTENGHEGGKWIWNTVAMLATNFTDNVVEFMITRMRHLSSAAQEILKVASCIGDRFTIDMVSKLIKHSKQSIQNTLEEIQHEQLVLEVLSKENNKTPLGQYRFVHDRVHQAAYELLPSEEKEELHFSIAKIMLHDAIEQQNLEDKIFNIVFQFNRGPLNNYQTTDLVELFHLNVKAGNKAKASFANQEAIGYYDSAISWMDSHFWDTNPAQAHQLFNDAMECAYLAGYYDKMKKYSDVILSKSESVDQTVNTYKIRIYAYVAQNQFLEATHLGLEILEKLGVHFPAKPNKLHIGWGLVKTKFRLYNRSIKELESLSPTTDPRILDILSLIVAFAAAAYHKVPELFPLVVFKLMELALKSGNAINNIPTYAGYGILLCGVTGEIDKGFEYGKLSVRLADSHDDHKQAKAKSYLIFTTFINHWKDHLRTSIPMLEQSYKAAMETGDQEYAAASLFMHSYHSFFVGESLDTLASRVKSYHKKTNQLKQQSYGLYSSIFYQGLLNLISQSKHPTVLIGNVFDERTFLTDSKNNNPDRTALFHIYFNKLLLSYWLDDKEESVANAEQLDKFLDVAVSTIFTPIYYFYDSLSRLSRLDALSKEEKRKTTKRIRANQGKLKKWASKAPMNFLHMYLIVDGYLRSKRDILEGIQVLEEGIVLANENGFLVDQAVGYELGFKLYHDAGNIEKGNTYLKEAYQLYQRWGAKAKKTQMRNKYGNLLEQSPKVGASEVPGFSSLSSSSLLDLSAILKASTAISSEIRLNKVIHQLLKIVIENAGAQSGIFMINNNNSLEIHATGRIEDEIRMVPPREINEWDPLPLSLIQYVSRSHEYVVLNDASQDSKFSLDPYIQSKRLKSILCIPIVSKNNLIGIIYLENNLNQGAFTNKRVAILQMLSGQIAITLENSILYASLEQKVLTRTREIDKQKEELKKKNLELMNINQEKNDLINIVSHDLRSPLTQIKGLASLVALSTNNSAKEYTDKIVQATDRLNTMITRILDISAIEAQKIEIKAEAFDLVEETRNILQNFETVAAAKNITLHLESEAPSLVVNLDKSYLIQIADNLLSNAIKFSYENDEVRIIINTTEFGVRLEVKDNGPGISVSDQKMLFSKFQKLTAQPTAGENSTGLGLSIVKRYVEAMGGKIWCNSQIDSGASFIVEFSQQ